MYVSLILFPTLKTVMKHVTVKLILTNQCPFQLIDTILTYMKKIHMLLGAFFCKWKDGAFVKGNISWSLIEKGKQMCMFNFLYPTHILYVYYKAIYFSWMPPLDCHSPALSVFQIYCRGIFILREKSRLIFCGEGTFKTATSI